MKRSIFAAFADLHGTIAAGEAGLMVLSNHYRNNKGIIRVKHNHLDNLKASMNFVQSMGDKEVILDTIGVSGILKKTINKYITG